MPPHHLHDDDDDQASPLPPLSEPDEDDEDDTYRLLEQSRLLETYRLRETDRLLEPDENADVNETAEGPPPLSEDRDHHEYSIPNFRDIASLVRLWDPGAGLEEVRRRVAAIWIDNYLRQARDYLQRTPDESHRRWQRDFFRERLREEHWEDFRSGIHDDVGTSASSEDPSN